MQSNFVLNRYKKNSFVEMIVDVDVKSKSNHSLVTQSVLTGLIQNRFLTDYEFPFSQVFEPYVLKEIAALEKQNLEDLKSLETSDSGLIKYLNEQYQIREQLSVLEKVNLASCFVSLIRYEQAINLLDSIADTTEDARPRFEIAFLRFIISNRIESGKLTDHYFAEMKSAIETGQIPNHRAIDACAQAVVWHCKGKEVSKDLFDWFVAQAPGILEDQTISSAARSSWYRAIAMVNAQQGDAEGTRQYMLEAKKCAVESISDNNQSAYFRELKKTYLESTLKEYLYVHKDQDKAIETAKELLHLDGNWSINWGELALIFFKFKEYEQAYTLYEKAVRMGPPYMCFHSLMAAKCKRFLGEDDVAQSIVESIIEILPDDAEAQSMISEWNRACS